MRLATPRRGQDRRRLARRGGEEPGPQAVEHASRERLQDLYEISKLLAGFESVAKTLPRILAVVTRTVALGRAILIVERDAIRSATVWTRKGLSPDGLDAARSHAEASLKYLIGAASGQPAERSTRDGRPPAKRERFVSLPLVVGRQRVFGVLQLEAAVLDEMDLGFVNAVANQLSIALQRDYAQAEREALLVREQAARADAEAANRAKDEFLALVSHELRTPLTAVSGWAHLLQGGRLNETQRATAVETIRRSAEAQKQLIDDLLDVRSINSGKLQIEIGAVNLADLIEEVRDSLTPAAAAKHIAVVVSLEAAPDLIPADPRRLLQVVWNLLSNAIKFTPEHGHVRIGLRDVDQHVEISVSDDGPGIPPAFLPHVFERFRQADPSSTRRHGGLGLGLAIAHSIVALHRGTATAANVGSGHGAVFTVTLPRFAAAETDAAPSWNDETGAAAVSLAGVRVLVVEDRLDDREVLTKMLEAAGANVTSAASAVEGLAALEHGRPHVLLSDVGMPGEDGYSFVRRVRGLPRDRGGLTPAVAITAYPDPGQRTLDAGFQAHIAKPVDPLRLALAVARLAPTIRREAG